MSSDQLTLARPTDQVSLRPIWRLFLLYLLLTFYAAAYVYFHATLSVPLYAPLTKFVAFDHFRIGDYAAIVLLTPIAMLPIGTRLRTPGQMIYALCCVFFFIPIPVVFLPMVGPAEYWTIYSVLWIGSLMLSSCSRLFFSYRVVSMSIAGYRKFSIAVVCAMAAAIFIAARQHFQLVSFEDIYQIREEIRITPALAYPINMFVGTFGGFAVATALAFRRPLLSALAVVAFFVAYGVGTAKAAALAPAWLLYFVIADRFFIKESVIRFLFVLMAPYLIGNTVWAVIGVNLPVSLVRIGLYEVYTLVNFRLFTIPPLAFNVYYDFFQTHPYTYWSHINVINQFITYPYAQPLPVVLQNVYHMGNYNSGFLVTDAVEAAGIPAIPLACTVVSGVFVALNTASQKLNVSYISVAMCTTLIAFIDISLATWLVSMGVGAMFCIFLFAPRDSASPLTQPFRRKSA